MMLTRLKTSIVLRFVFLLCAFVGLSQSAISQSRHFPRGTHDVYITPSHTIRTHLLRNIAPIIEKSIAKGHYPGAVVLVAHEGEIIYRGVFGSRRIVPTTAPMRFNTVFDIASLTKIVATTPAMMQLLEQGKVELDANVAKYWPAFSKQNKQSITVRELLTHTSGLPAQVKKLTNEKDILKQIIEIKPKHAPGKVFLYSDLNFIILAHLVEVISGEKIDQYSKKHIFNPLKMQDTFYTPSSTLRDRISPTEMQNKKLRWGKVHDPAAYAMGGVAGNAGLFSNAKDLGLYAQSLLDGGRLSADYQDGKNRLSHFLGPLTIAKMTTPQTPDNIAEARGLGWDIDSAFSNRGLLFPTRSFGHSGWTGTSMWIDPVTKTWIIILTSRAHPTPAKSNQLIQDRRLIANIISASIINIKNEKITNTGRGEIKRAYAHAKR